MARYKHLTLSAYASIGAGVIHAQAIGMHVEHLSLARIFVVMAIAQIGWGMWALLHSERPLSLLGVGINVIAMGGWFASRFVGISWISGLEVREAPQVADSLGAVLAALVILGALLAYVQGENTARKITQSMSISVVGIVALLTFSALWVGASRVPNHSQAALALVDTGLTIDAKGVIVSPSTNVPVVEPSTTVAVSVVPALITVVTPTTLKRATTTIAPTTTVHAPVQTSDQLLAAASGWPRAYDPAKGEDFSGIAGATPEQKARAMALIANNSRDIAKFKDQNVAIAEGYVSIGDESTGFEHLIKSAFLNDGRVLDTMAPETLVYQVSGLTRTLVSVMYMAAPGTPINDSTLVNYAGGLMQWHVHTNLCWNIFRKVVGVTDAAGNCPPGSYLDPAKPTPMVHVWIAAHPCGPFAALEGNGAGIAELPDSQRIDKCNAKH